MSTVIADAVTYESHMESLPLELAEPSAPMYPLIDCEEPVSDLRKREEITPCKNAPINDPEPSPAARVAKIQLDLKKAQIMRELLEKERQAMEEEFKAKELLLEAEVEQAVSSLNGLALDKTNIDNTNQSAVCSADKPSDNHVEQETLTNNGPTSSFADSAEYKQVQYSVLENERQTPFNPQVTAGPMFTELLGLGLLKILDEVTVRQLPTPDLCEKYEVLAETSSPDGYEVVLRVSLICGIANMGLPSQKRVLKVVITDKNHHEVGTYCHGADGMELFLGRKLVAVVRRPYTIMKPMIIIYDCFSQPVLKIKGSTQYTERHHFSIQTASKMVIGFINKSASVSRSHTSSGPTGDLTVIRFPLDLDVRFKLALIASSFYLVDQKQQEARELKWRELNASRVHYMTQ